MLNITRTWNAVGATASMARALSLARDYATRRHAFGKRLIDQPLHAQTLADMQAEFEGAFALTFEVAHLLGDAQLLEGRDDLVIGVDRAGQGVGGGVLVEGGHPHAPLGQQGGKDRPGRPEADRQHVAIEVAHLKLRWRRGCRAPPDPRSRPAPGRHL